jgi:hypothetical protein
MFEVVDRKKAETKVNFKTETIFKNISKSEGQLIEHLKKLK